MTAFHTLLLNGIFLGLNFLILPFDTFLLFHFVTVCIQISYAVAVFWQFRGQQVTVYAFVALAAAVFASCLVCYAFGQPLAMYGICLLQLCLDAAAFLILRKCVTDMPVSIARHFFIAFIIDGLIWVCVLLLRSLYASPSDLSCNFVLLAGCAICNIVLLLLSSYFYTKLKSASNTYFFSRIFKASSFSAPSISSEPSIEDYFLLATFISPSSFIARIRDEITPYVGSFGIKSQIEYELPSVTSNNNAINVPIIFQGKCELTRELTFSSPQGYALHRLSDDELKGAIQKELEAYFKIHKYPALVQAGPFVDFIFSYNRFQDDDQFKARAIESITRAFGLNDVDVLDAFIHTDQLHEESVSFLKMLLNSYRFVKPIVLEVSPRQGFPKRLIVNVERHVPQVPLREYSSRRMVLILARIKRFFTKKRMHYYFGLGSADCARSYHLAFHGLSDCYLAGMNINTIGTDDFCMAKEMNVSNRYDQQFSRLYIREGHGFSRAVLELSYERRSQKPVATLCFVSASCLVILVYLFISSGLSSQITVSAIIFKSKTSQYASDLFRLITIMSAATIVSVWQTMHDYYAEEWLWLGVGAVATSSVLALVLGLVLYFCGDYNGVIKFMWVLLICIVFLAFLGSSLALYGKIKLHGDLMSRVPVSRSLSDSSEATMVVKSDSALHPESDIRAATTAQVDNSWTLAVQSYISDLPRDFTVSDRLSEYLASIYPYRCLIGPHWKDGWLVPVWASAVNPYHQPSNVYMSLYEEAR